MGRIAKIKRLVIEEANKRILGEQRIDEIPSDTTIVKVPLGGDNSIMVTSKEKDIAHPYKLQIIADGRIFNPNIESIKLVPNDYLQLKIKLTYGTGSIVKSRLSKAKTAMQQKGIDYRFISGGVTSSDRIVFTIHTDKNKDTRTGIAKAIEGDKPITLTHSNGVKVKLI